MMEEESRNVLLVFDGSAPSRRALDPVETRDVLVVR
jgi:hypothetical protein